MGGDMTISPLSLKISDLADLSTNLKKEVC
jgi:hypothetical protein